MTPVSNKFFIINILGNGVYVFELCAGLVIKKEISVIKICNIKKERQMPLFLSIICKL